MTPIPNYTQIPNCLLDRMFDFTHTEFKVLMFVCRQTFGWQREKRHLSYSYIETGTGLCREAVNNALVRLVSNGILSQTSFGQSFEYSVCLETTGSPNRLALVRQTDRQLVRQTDTTNKGAVKKGTTKKGDDTFASKSGSSISEKKAAALKAVPVPAATPSADEFQSFLEAFPLVSEYRSALFDELTETKWCRWDRKRHRWQPIRHWREWVAGLEASLEKSQDKLKAFPVRENERCGELAALQAEAKRRGLDSGAGGGQVVSHKGGPL